jgi:integrase
MLLSPIPAKPNPSVSQILTLPVQVRKVEGLPKLIAGGVPVTPINVVLARRKMHKGATEESLDAYRRASRLYSEFCAHLERSIIDITNSEFNLYKNALLGKPFYNSNGELVRLIGKRERGERTADLMVSLIYSLAADIEELYDVRFDWRRHHGLPSDVMSAMRAAGVKHKSPRAHHVKWTPRKITALPDGQFVKLIEAARRRWENVVADGDLAFDGNPESQRGALYIRNVSILSVLRFEGSRRSEVTFINLEDIDRANKKLLLVTKGHGGEFGERLPVLLFPFVDKLLWRYVTKYRPVADSVTQRVFLSHSVRNYGQPITPQTVRKLVDGLKVELDPPWNEMLTPHMLRHSYAYQIQKVGGEAAVTANMRHASSSSCLPYAAGVEVFADHILESLNGEIARLFTGINLPDVIWEGGERGVE